MQCEQAEALLLDLAYGELDAETARRVDLHLEGCASCQRQRASYQQLRMLARQLPELSPPPSRFAALLAEAEAAVKPPAPVKILAPAAPSFWERVRALFTPPVFAAASLVLLVGGVFLLSTQAEPPRSSKLLGEDAIPAVSARAPEAPRAVAPTLADLPAPAAEPTVASPPPAPPAEIALAPRPVDSFAKAPGAGSAQASKKSEAKPSPDADAGLAPSADDFLEGTAQGYFYGQAESGEAADPSATLAQAKSEAAAKRCAQAEDLARRLQTGSKEAGEALLATARCFAQTDPAKSRALYRELTGYAGVAEEARRALAASEKKKEAPSKAPVAPKGKALDPSPELSQ